MFQVDSTDGNSSAGLQEAMAEQNLHTLQNQVNSSLVSTCAGEQPAGAVGEPASDDAWRHDQIWKPEEAWGGCQWWLMIMLVVMFEMIIFIYTIIVTNINTNYPIRSSTWKTWAWEASSSSSHFAQTFANLLLNTHLGNLLQLFLSIWSPKVYYPLLNPRWLIVQRSHVNCSNLGPTWLMS